MRPVILLLLLIVATPLHAQQVAIYDSGGPILPEQAAFDVTFYDLDVQVFPETRSIAGSVTTVADLVEPTREFVLNLDTLLVVSAIDEVSGVTPRPLEWERRLGQLWIDLGTTRPVGDEVSVRVTYSGTPRVAPQAPWDGGFVWSRTQSGAPWIATAVQEEGPDIWWPAKDHVSDKPDSVAIHVRVPEPLVVATNGRPLRVESHADGTRTYHNFVSTPISAYNVALNIAPYRLIEGQLDSIGGQPFPVTFYVLPEDLDKGKEFFPEILEHLTFFEHLIGPYPFRADGYKVAETPHLGMEHQTVIAYGGDFNPGAMTGGRDWGFDALHHHELSHEWWGNLVTNADWKDMWIHEGFATYMQALYAGKLGGEDMYRAYLADERLRITNRTPVAPRESRTSGQIYVASGNDIYSKGAWFLHTLRWLIGDPAFFESLKTMAYPDPADQRVTDGSQTRLATTDDYLDIAEAVSGQDLDWVFELYLRQPGLPRLVAGRSGNTVHLEWRTPNGIPFPMPIELAVDGERRRVEMVNGTADVQVPAGSDVVVDPDEWILRADQAPVMLPGV